MGVGVGWGVGVGAGKEDGTWVVDLLNEALGEEAVGIGEGSGSNVRQGGWSTLCKGMGNGVGSRSQKAS